MAEEPHPHETGTSVVGAAPPEFAAGAEAALKVKVSCPSSCDLSDDLVKIIAQDGIIVKEAKLVTFDGTVNQTDEFVVKAPAKLGENTWTAFFPAQEKEGTLHGESSTPFSFIVKPHTTTVNVLDSPDPVSSDEEFRIKVEVKCSAGCKLTQKVIEIYDNKEVRVATGTLGEVQQPGPTALWCAEVGLKAPNVERRYRWTVNFPKPDLQLPHEGSSCTFDFGVASHPESLVTIEVVDKDTNTPIKNAQVLLRPTTYRGSAYTSRTNDGGVARLSVPKGEYQLYVSGDGKEFFLPIVGVGSNLTLKAEVFVRHREAWDW